MDTKRANQILTSNKMVDVTYHGELIYIDDVNPTMETAKIHYLNRPGDRQEVSVTQLVESE